jgi:hypothetical protein
MADEQAPDPNTEPQSEPEASDSTSASQDLSEGLDLMLRAARKAMSRVNSSKLEAAGRRALDKLESLDAKKVGELGKKAAKNLDPRRIEEIAEEAGRELISVIERVADRVESAVGGSARDRKGSAGSEAADDAPAEPRPRVRVDDDKD